MAGYVERMGKKGKCIEGLVGKREEKGQLDRSRRRWDDTAKMNFEEIRWENVN